MSHTHHGQTYMRRQVSKQSKNEGGQISVNAPRPKRRYPNADTFPGQNRRLHKDIGSQNLPLISPEKQLTDFVWPQLSPPSSKTSRWNKNRDPLPRSARGHHSLIHQRKSSFNTAVTAGVTKNRVTRKYSRRQETNTFLSSKTERLHSQTRRRWEFFFIFAISKKILIRQQSSSERHGCSLLHQCCSYLIATAHVVWWSEMLTGLSRVVFSLKRKTVCLSKAFGSARSKTWLLDKVNWMFSPPRGGFWKSGSKADPAGGGALPVAKFLSTIHVFLFSFFFCVWQEENTGLHSSSMCRQFGGNIHVDNADDIVWNISSGANSRSQKPPKGAPDRAGITKTRHIMRHFRSPCTSAGPIQSLDFSFVKLPQTSHRRLFTRV